MSEASDSSKEQTRIWRRLAGAWVGAVVGTLAAAMLDAAWASGAQADVGYLGALMASLGLLAPLALLLGVVAAGMALVLHARGAPSLRGLVGLVGVDDDAARARLSWFALAVGVAVLVWLVFGAHLALGVLASDLPPGASGSAMAAGVATLALMLVGASHTLASWLAVRFPRGLPPVVAIVAALLVVGMGFVGLVATGSTSGTGGLSEIFGVFRRPELDLRAVSLVGAIALCGYVGTALLARVPFVVAVVVALLPLVSTGLAASRTLEERTRRIAIERSAPLGSKLMGPLRKLRDADGDGYSPWFGGGDCNDADARFNPEADDVPGNGVDEDCSGKDAVAIAFEKPAEEKPKSDQEWVEAKLPEKMNVILLTVDTLRWDLGYTGYERKISPNIDAFAKRSTVFDKAYALASYTSKSLPPMLIGKYPSETHMDWSHFNRFGQKDTFVQERLQKAGIRTISVQGYWYFFYEGYGFERGFDVIDSSAAPKVIQMEGDRTVNADKVSDAAIAELSKPENVARQFFLWAHYVDPHAEYVKHEEFDFGPGSRERYDSEVAFVDKHLGRVLDFVKKSEFADNTAIILTSDHGEAFGEHGMIRHGFEIWEELVRVPLIVYAPGAEPHRVEKRRGIIDVVPTILDFYGLPKPEAPDETGDASAPAAADFLSGQSLLYDVYMPPGHEPEKRIVFVDMAAGPNNAERQAFIEDDYKLIASSGRVLGLYNLEKDPAEKEDLAKQEELADKVAERYKAFRRELRQVPLRPR